MLGAVCRSEASQPQAEPAAEEDDAGIAFHAFLEKFSTRMKASPTKLTAREIFEELDADRDKLVSEQEVRRFRCAPCCRCGQRLPRSDCRRLPRRELVPAPAMTKQDFFNKYIRSLPDDVTSKERAEVLLGAWERLDADGDGALMGPEEVAGLGKVTEHISEILHEQPGFKARKAESAKRRGLELRRRAEAVG